MCGGPFFLDFTYKDQAIDCYVKAGRDDIIIADEDFEKLVSDFKKYNIFKDIIFDSTKKTLTVLFQDSKGIIHSDGFLEISGPRDRTGLMRVVNTVGALTYLTVLGTDGPIMDANPMKERLLEHLEEKERLNRIRSDSAKKLARLEEALSKKEVGA